MKLLPRAYLLPSYCNHVAASCAYSQALHLTPQPGQSSASQPPATQALSAYMKAQLQQISLQDTERLLQACAVLCLCFSFCLWSISLCLNLARTAVGSFPLLQAQPNPMVMGQRRIVPVNKAFRHFQDGNGDRQFLALSVSVLISVLGRYPQV